MAHRKFYYDDMVKVISLEHNKHRGHIGSIQSSRIRKLPLNRGTRVTYTVDCQCGKRMMLNAHHMDLVSGVEQEDKKISLHEARLEHFIRACKLVPLKRSLDEQVQGLLARLNDRDKYIISNRYGLNGTPGKTFQALADEENLTRGRINQIEKRILINLRKEKHED